VLIVQNNEFQGLHLLPQLLGRKASGVFLVGFEQLRAELEWLSASRKRLL
jgi:hypothetical protein